MDLYKDLYIALQVKLDKIKKDFKHIIGNNT